MPVSETTLTNLVNRLDHLCTQLENQQVDKPQHFQDAINQHKSHNDKNSTVNSHSVSVYDEMINEPLQNYLNLSKQQAGLVEQQAQKVTESFGKLREILIQASQSKTPTKEMMTKIAEPLVKILQQAAEMAENNRGSPSFNQLSVVASSVPALAWINVTLTPAPYIKDMLDSGTFYSNKVIMENKGKDPLPINWAKAWDETIKKLYEYVKMYHTTGLAWNVKGKDTPLTTSNADTQNLKKVTDSDKNYKNKDLKASGTVPSEIKGTGTMSKGGNAPQTLENQIKDKKANVELQGNRWVVEYHLNNPQILVNAEEIKQVVYIYKCVNSTVQVKGKVNSISLDNCKKCALVFDSVISQVEVTNSQSAQIQILQKCPMICLDNCDGAQVYLSKESMDIQVISAKSTQINLLVPQEEEGDYKEFPVPEQYKTLWSNDHFETTAVEKKG